MFNLQTKISCLMMILCACGTIIGNGIEDPTKPPVGAPSPTNTNLDFNAPINEYNANAFADCGSFDENSSAILVDNGRQCIRDALNSCTQSKYLMNKTNTNTSRFVSYVEVEKIPVDPTHCQLHIHTVSNVEPNAIGDKTKTCTTLNTSEIPEVACGIQ